MRNFRAMPVAALVFTIFAALCGGLGCAWAVSPEPDAAAAGAVSGDNPYHGIASRNIFALKPPPPPPDPTAAPPPDLPQIKLQGISALFGRRQVLVKLVEKAKPGQPGKEEALILKEGERYRDVEVVAIDPASGTVRFNNHGTEVVMTMEKDAEKPPAGPAPTAPPAAPAVAMARPGMPQPMPVPTAGPGAPPPPIAAAGVVHTPAPGAAPGVAPSTGITAPGVAVAPPPAPSLVLAGGGGPGGQTLTPSPTPPPPPLSREEQEIIIEINRLRYQQEGDPRAKLLPPTSLTPQVQQPPPAPY